MTKKDGLKEVLIDRKRVEASGYFQAMMAALNDSKNIIGAMLQDVDRSNAIRIEISMIKVEDDGSGDESDSGAGNKSGDGGESAPGDNATDAENSVAGNVKEDAGDSVDNEPDISGEFLGDEELTDPFADVGKEKN